MKKLTAAALAPVLALLFGSPAMAAETKGKRVDINTATAEQLMAIPGVSADDAEKIMAARPYQKKDDLKDRQVLTAEQYEAIKKLLDSVC